MLYYSNEISVPGGIHGGVSTFDDGGDTTYRWWRSTLG
jgi:hypothetical protein